MEIFDSTATIYFIVSFITSFLEVVFELRKKTKTAFNFKMTVINMSIHNLMLIGKLFNIPAVLAYWWLYRQYPDLHLAWSTDVWWHWVVTFLLVDLTFYIYHYAAHNCNILWAVHTVHHQSTDYNLSLAGRNAVIEGFVRLLTILPLAVIGLPPQLIFPCIVVSYMHTAWIHTQNIDKLGFLEYIFTTPSQHRVHHYKDISAIGASKNLAGVFVFWDKLFGNFLPEKDRNQKFGIMGSAPLYNPIRCQTYFFEHLFKLFWKTPSIKDKFRLLFTDYMPEPVKDFGADEHPTDTKFDISDFILCLVVTYLSWHVLTISTAKIHAIMVKRGKIPDFEDILSAGFLILVSTACISFLCSLIQKPSKLKRWVTITLSAIMVGGLAWRYVAPFDTFVLHALANSKFILILASSQFLIFASPHWFNKLKPTNNHES